MTEFNFNPAEYDSDGPESYEPLPRGRYALKAVEVSEQVAKSGNGEYLKVKFEVARGEHTGRKLFVNYNTNHTNETAQRIGREHIRKWMLACGKPNAKDSDQLLEVEFEAEVGIENGRGDYGPSNRIMRYIPKDGEAPTPTPSRPAASRPASSETKNTAATPAKSGGARKNPWDD